MSRTAEKLDFCGTYW